MNNNMNGNEGSGLNPAQSQGDVIHDDLVTNFEIKLPSLKYLKKCCDYLQPKDETSYLLLVEKLIYLSMEYKNQNEGRPDDLPEEIYSYVEHYLDRMNNKSVELYNNNKVEEASRIMARIVDLITQKNFSKVIVSNDKEKQKWRYEKLADAKILAYNNLSCIYRKIGNYPLALKVVNYALNLEEQLVEKDYGNSALSIVTTYLNRSAILTNMKKYEKSIESVYKCLDFLRRAEEKNTVLTEDRKRSICTSYMSAYYNLGVEYEHLDVNTKAHKYYEKAKAFASDLGDKGMVSRIEESQVHLKDSSGKADF